MQPETARRVLLSDDQRRDWLRLLRSEGVGPRTFRSLVNRFGGAGAALDALPDYAARAGRPVKVFSEKETDAELLFARRLGVRFVAMSEPDYPPALRQVGDAPPLLAVRGAGEALRRHALAIVGSRNASANGLRLAESFAAGVGGEGYTIVSGLARGIDARAHVGAMTTGTVAVLAGGHARIYPADHEPLADRIVEAGGALISEMPVEWEPRGRDFPRRNRIVSGMCLGTLVVEAARKSGSLITARFAAEQGRVVFAMPGSPLDPRAGGTNDLLRDGAQIAFEVEHVVSALQPMAGTGHGAFFAAPPAKGQMEFLWDELDPAGEGSGPVPALDIDAFDLSEESLPFTAEPEPEMARARVVAALSAARSGSMTCPG